MSKRLNITNKNSKIQKKLIFKSKIKENKSLRKKKERIFFPLKTINITVVIILYKMKNSTVQSYVNLQANKKLNPKLPQRISTQINNKHVIQNSNQSIFKQDNIHTQLDYARSINNCVDAHNIALNKNECEQFTQENHNKENKKINTQELNQLSAYAPKQFENVQQEATFRQMYYLNDSIHTIKDQYLNSRINSTNNSNNLYQNSSNNKSSDSRVSVSQQKYISLNQSTDNPKYNRYKNITYKGNGEKVSQNKGEPITSKGTGNRYSQKQINMSETSLPNDLDVNKVSQNCSVASYSQYHSFPFTNDDSTYNNQSKQKESELMNQKRIESHILVDKNLHIDKSQYELFKLNQKHKQQQQEKQLAQNMHEKINANDRNMIERGKQNEEILSLRRELRTKLNEEKVNKERLKALENENKSLLNQRLIGEDLAKKLKGLHFILSQERKFSTKVIHDNVSRNQRISLILVNLVNVIQIIQNKITNPLSPHVVILGQISENLSPILHCLNPVIDDINLYNEKIIHQNQQLSREPTISIGKQDKKVTHTKKIQDKSVGFCTNQTSQINRIKSDNQYLGKKRCISIEYVGIRHNQEYPKNSLNQSHSSCLLSRIQEPTNNNHENVHLKQQRFANKQSISSVNFQSSSFHDGKQTSSAGESLNQINSNKNLCNQKSFYKGLSGSMISQEQIQINPKLIQRKSKQSKLYHSPSSIQPSFNNQQYLKQSNQSNQQSQEQNQDFKGLMPSQQLHQQQQQSTSIPSKQLKDYTSIPISTFGYFPQKDNDGSQCSSHRPQRVHTKESNDSFYQQCFLNNSLRVSDTSRSCTASNLNIPEINWNNKTPHIENFEFDDKNQMHCTDISPICMKNLNEATNMDMNGQNNNILNNDISSAYQSDGQTLNLDNISYQRLPNSQKMNCKELDYCNKQLNSRKENSNTNRRNDEGDISVIKKIISQQNSIQYFDSHQKDILDYEESDLYIRREMKENFEGEKGDLEEKEFHFFEKDQERSAITEDIRQQFVDDLSSDNYLKDLFCHIDMDKDRKSAKEDNKGISESQKDISIQESEKLFNLTLKGLSDTLKNLSHDHGPSYISAVPDRYTLASSRSEESGSQKSVTNGSQQLNWQKSATSLEIEEIKNKILLRQSKRKQSALLNHSSSSEQSLNNKAQSIF